MKWFQNSSALGSSPGSIRPIDLHDVELDDHAEVVARPNAIDRFRKGGLPLVT